MNDNKTVEELVSNNIKLVYYFYNKLKQSDTVKTNKEDLISEGMVGLVKAAKTYDLSKSKFPTYASYCINNSFFMYLRKLNKYTGKEISIDSTIGIDNEGNELCISDILNDKKDNIEDLITNLDLNSFIDKQKAIDLKIIKLKLQGKNHKEIAKEVNLSQSYIARKLIQLSKNYIKING